MTKKLINKLCATLLLLIQITFLLTGCTKSTDSISDSGFYFDTVITITLYDIKDDSLIKQCFSLCKKYDDLFSTTKEGSDVWNINHSLGSPTEVSDETAYLIRTALSYSELSNGSIDLTTAPLSDLWNFSSTKERFVPSDTDIQALLPHVNYKNVILDKNTVTILDPEAAIDLGFIAKGYIADKLKEFLIQKKVSSAIINLGGNVVTVGNKLDGSPFQIGIQKPFDSLGSAITSVSSSNSSVVSSGVYERYFKQDGKLYYHILNPKTGYPYETNLLGVTILSVSSTQGDALSTTCFTLGLKDGMKLIESLDQVEAIFITDDYQLHYSSGLR